MRRKISQRRKHLVARGFQEVGAQVDRGALGERPALVRRAFAKACLELRRKPFGKIAQNMRRRAGQVRGNEPLALRLGELRGRVAFAGEQRSNRLGVEAARLPKRAEHFGPRGRLRP